MAKLLNCTPKPAMLRLVQNERWNVSGALAGLLDNSFGPGGGNATAVNTVANHSIAKPDVADILFRRTVRRSHRAAGAAMKFDYRDYWSERDEWLIESDEEFLEKSDCAQKEFEAGDLTALPDFINSCFLNNRPVPDWAKQAFIAAFRKVWCFEVKSWDEVFGQLLEKGKQLATERRKLKLVRPIWWEVQMRRLAGESITKEMFDAIGNELGVSGTVAAELYYEIHNELGEEFRKEMERDIHNWRSDEFRKEKGLDAYRKEKERFMRRIRRNKKSD